MMQAAGVLPAGTQQAAAQFAQTQRLTPPAQGQVAEAGALGPTAPDPRDVLRQQLATRQGLMGL